MQFASFCILLLAIYEPLQILAEQIVLVVPRQIRRSPAAPWRNNPSQYRKSSPHTSNDFHHHHHHHHPFPNHPNAFHASKPPPFSKGPPYPHGGDDFDGDHDVVNHVRIPYSKDISHAISFGKGYIPYDTIKEGFTPGEQERYAGKYSRYNNDHEYSPSISSSASDFAPGPSNYQADDSGLHISSEDSDGMDYHERRNDRSKYYAARSVGKTIGASSQNLLLHHAATIDNEGSTPKGSEYLKDTGLPDTRGLHGSIILPGGVPSATIGGSKEGIVIRDTVILDEYNRKMQEFTQNWPTLMAAITSGQTVAPGVASAFIPAVQGQQPSFVQHPLQQSIPQYAQQYTQQYPQQYSPQYPQYQQSTSIQQQGITPTHTLSPIALSINPYPQYQQQQQQQPQIQIPTAAGASAPVPVAAALTSSTGWLPNIAQSKQGYSVREDQSSNSFPSSVSMQNAALQIIPIGQAQLNSYGTLRSMSQG